MPSIQAVRDQFYKKKVFLFDLDGTLYLGKKTLPGAVNLVKNLRCQNKKLFFFTNNSSRSQRDYVKKLNGMKFDVSPAEIIMSTHSLMTALKKKRWKKIYLLGTPAMKEMLEGDGFKITSSKPQAVVVGFDKTLTYEKLQKATDFILAGGPYVVTHPDYYCPIDGGREPDCGAMAKLLELVTEKKPAAVLGKPNPLMIEEVFQRVKFRKSEVVLVGDRLYTDIAMGKNAGIDTLLVLSGDTSPAALKKSKLKPRWVLKSVSELLR